jgi:hypothetical protein
MGNGEWEMVKDRSQSPDVVRFLPFTVSHSLFTIYRFGVVALT